MHGGMDNEHNRRSMAETAMYCTKQLLGDSRDYDGQVAVLRLSVRVEQDDKGWDARKRAYCLKIQPATGRSCTKSYLFNKAI